LGGSPMSIILKIIPYKESSQDCSATVNGTTPEDGDV
jgi:hypothetical protein